MPATLRDVASQLNLSPALVSRVLNNKAGVRASEETQRRIRKTAREMKYRPSASARALSTGRTMQLAISAADADLHQGHSGRLSEVLGLIEAAAPHQYRVLVLPSPAHRTDRRDLEALIHASGCDGFCIYAEQADAALYDLLREHEMPFVVVGNPGDPSLPQVDHDNYRYAYDSVAWLRAQGHTRIAFVEFVSHTNQPYIGVLRRGYQDAMEALCGGYDPALDLLRADLPLKEQAEFVTGPAAPTALIVRELSNALRWETAIQSQGMRIREDIVLLPHMLQQELQFLPPGYAYHAHDPRAVGVRAGEVLIQWILDGKMPESVLPILVAPLGPCWHCDAQESVCNSSSSIVPPLEGR